MPVRTPADLPMPPLDLLRRIGVGQDRDPEAAFVKTGELHRRLLDEHLPADWSWGGKRILDFGCGVGRMLRQFAAESGESEIFGCDLDRPSVEWLRENLSPPFQVFESAEEAGLPQEDGFFDLIYAFSVYTHFTDNWAAWLREHHRVLADGGILFATFLGEGMLEPLTGERWDEDRIGMNPLMQGLPWDEGGPIAVNSRWWIEAHWGRAFEILELVPRLEPDRPSHGLVVARKKAVEITAEELERLEPDEPREIAALRHHVRQLEADARDLRRSHKALERQLAALEAEGKAEAERAKQLVESLETSRSWRLTAPLRSATRRLRSGN
ncbi:MAG: methyltransferase domain-containing protein [Solirubrobacterales bacterium]